VARNHRVSLDLIDEVAIGGTQKEAARPPAVQPCR
jgi:hypothetical protein